MIGESPSQSAIRKVCLSPCLFAYVHSYERKSGSVEAAVILSYAKLALFPVHKRVA